MTNYQQFINKTKFLEQLNQEFQALLTTPHDHIEEEIRMYDFIIDKIETTESVECFTKCEHCCNSEEMDSVLYCHYFNKNVDKEGFCSYGG